MCTNSVAKRTKSIVAADAELGKQRVITVVDDVVVGRKDPQDEHHPDCVPMREEEVTATALDREMRHEV